MNSNATFPIVLAVLAAAGCGTSSNPSAAGSPPALVGQYAFAAARVTASSQTGGGSRGGDNLTIFIGEGCSGGGDKTLTIQLFTRDQSPLTPGVYSVESPSSDGANLYASVRYQDLGGDAMTSVSAESGVVTMDNVSTTSLLDNRGSFAVTWRSPTEGSGTLEGTFDGRYRCR